MHANIFLSRGADAFVWREVTKRLHGFISDTFASKVAACQDKYADASVGNVTGSNAVNVFLGIGVAWSIAAIYHAYHGKPFLVEPGKWVVGNNYGLTSEVVKVS